MPKTTYDKKTGAKTVLDEKGKTVYNKDGSKVTYNSKGKTTYAKDGTRTVLDKKGKTVYDKDGYKTTYNSKGKTEYDKYGTKTTYDKKGKTVLDKDGWKTIYDKKGETTYTPDGSKNVRDKSGETWYFASGNKRTYNKEGETRYYPDGSKTTYNKQGKTEYDKSGKNLTEAARLAAEKKAADKKVVAKEPSKTVSQIWKEKTGTEWSEAKKQGLSDGSAKSNLDLLKKLNSGSLDKDKQLPAKMETIKATDMKVSSTGPKELVMTAEQRMHANSDKLNKEKMKTGGMVNSNSKITASKKTTGKVGGITKAISKVVVKTTSPKRRVGGTSKAPKKAMIKKGGMTKKKK
jgi:hypothetical protein